MIDRVLQETVNRTNILYWAYSYEFEDDSIVPDVLFDNISKQIDVNISTGDDDLDLFFKNEFAPNTGMWIRKYPKLEELKEKYLKYNS